MLLPRPGYDDDDDDDDDPPASLFYSAGTLPRQENIPLSDSRAFYRDQPGLPTSPFDLANNDDSSEEQEGGPYSDYSYSSRISGLDMSEDTQSSQQLKTPAGIYLDVPPPVSSSAYPSKNSLRESLLPTNNMIPQGITTVKPREKYKDPAFAVLYIGCMIVFFVVGIVLLRITNSHDLDQYSKKVVFFAIRDTAGTLTFIVTLCVALGAIWVYTLRRFVRNLVWCTLITVPIVSLIAFIWALVESLSGDGIGHRDTGLMMASFFPLTIGLIYLRLIIWHRKTVEKTIQVIELACDILRANPGMFVVSLVLMGIFLLFTMVWLFLFSRLWLVGYTRTGPWILDGKVAYTILFFVILYLWTAALLSNIQRFTLAGITAQWYFHRHDPTNQLEGSATRAALMRATKTSFGTVAFGALTLSIVQVMQLALRYYRKYVKSNDSNAIFIMLAGGLACLEGFIETINNYTIIFAGITADSFCSSAITATRIFRRNLVSGLLTDLVVKMILNIGSIVIAILSGLGTWIFAMHTLHSPYGFVVGTVAAVVPLYVAQFYTNIVMIIVDAMYMCYAIDLDTGTVHNEQAHLAFSNK